MIPGANRAFRPNMNLWEHFFRALEEVSVKPTIKKDCTKIIVPPKEIPVDDGRTFYLTPENLRSLTGANGKRIDSQA